eukprot:Gregarina_sp_Poly_1__10675@NODE_806_length_6222_cov_150_300406_g580_i1_p1_GENE_NODE_806_length_6222_cov_150_300406_g580_i1NODE_806_length_6222_cov_150_300406_g580_i1_p1_ORF_typecomplete_len497_score65_67Ank_4/PF13637_6/0_0015Ank_4/PF13637_6/0_11Ank/PF00023_30/4_8e05Ank/PF00023_30/31Ank_5/PF13857_6/0_001Ank_5/PF13857_6/2_6Ank_3/PF13606_6/4_8e03Ank_3/PF13606_6/1_3e05Ank_3/PF13606_6/5_4e03Ank_2/PF12796_7/0_002Ank_2/PF12796_7/98DCB/PF16213_5/0_25_NODE_806_length_6222_cov_150_300406_g580_i118373327
MEVAPVRNARGKPHASRLWRRGFANTHLLMMVDDIGGWFGLARKRKSSPGAGDKQRINLGRSCKRRRRTTRSPKCLGRRRLSRCKLNDTIVRGSEEEEEIDGEASRHDPESPLHMTPSTIATAFEATNEGVDDLSMVYKSVKFPSFPFRKIQSPVQQRLEEQEAISASVCCSESDDKREVLCMNDSPPTPGAPRRPKSMNWLRFMLDNADDELKAILASDETVDLTADVFVEWVSWNPKDKNLESSSTIWISPLALACRWNSPKIIQTLIDAGADVHTLNHLQQNLLIILCSQPVLTVEVILCLRDFYKPEIFNFTRYQLSEGCEPSAAVKHFIRLRKQEMLLVAQLLLLYGVSPLARDTTGKCARDYCLAFGHKSILKVFDIAVNNPRIYMALQPVLTPVVDPQTCHTPPRQGRSRSGICTPRTSCRTPERREECFTPLNNMFSTPITDSINCPSSLPTGCPSTGLHVKRRGRRLSRKQIEATPTGEVDQLAVDA